MSNAFHFSSLVWHETVAIYLFLLGISSGATLLALLFKRSQLVESPNQSWLIRCAAIIAPAALVIGLTILIFHLTMPWRFWKLMLHYQPRSVMSMGVMMFQIYMVTLCGWIATIYQDLIRQLLNRFLPKWTDLAMKIIDFLRRFESAMEIFLMFLAILVGAYTGFLLSALISYPLLNNPLLPVLFLASGLSSGVAVLVIAVMTIGKLNAHSTEIKFLHRFEIPVALIEFFLLFAYFVGLYFGGGQKTQSLYNALSSFWGDLFFVGVLSIGVVVPLMANSFASDALKHNKKFILALAGCSLFGVLSLRFFILYAGQMTLA